MSTVQPTYSVGQVARLAGVTVRTLHHYDEVGLLPPSGRSANGYRMYTAIDIARLQRILSWRALGFDLEQVARVLASNGTDRPATDQLRHQYALLRTQVERLQAIAATIAKTLEAHEMGIHLTPEEMLDVFGAHDPTEHLAEVQRRWGDTDAFAQSQRRTSEYGKNDWLDVKTEAEQVTAGFAAALDAGLPPTSERAATTARAHRAHINERYYELDDEAHQGLARMYVSDDRFMRNYDEVRPGLARYVCDAILALYSPSAREGSSSPAP